MNRASSGGDRKPRRVPTLLVGLGILALGVSLASWWLTNRPKAEQRHRPRMAPMVEVAPLSATIQQVRLEAIGKVLPADYASIQAEVSGRVEWVHPELVEGGSVTNGTLLIRLDPREYRFRVEQQQAALAAVEGDFRIEVGRQDIAKQEFAFLREERSETELDRELALRAPQLKSAEAAVASARAALASAELSLERTQIKAPFDAVISKAPADVGDRASPGSMLAELIGTDRYWVKVSLRTEDVKWVQLPDANGLGGSPAVIRLPDGGMRKGVVYKRLPGLEANGRMAQVLVAVENPLRLDDFMARSLLLDELVRVEISGRSVPDVIRIPRVALRDGTALWLLDAEKKLRFHPADILWGGANEVYVRNEIPPGTRLIVSSIGTPVEGMSLLLEGDRPPGGPPQGPPGKKPGGEKR